MYVVMHTQSETKQLCLKTATVHVFLHTSRWRQGSIPSRADALPTKLRQLSWAGRNIRICKLGQRHLPRVILTSVLSICLCICTWVCYTKYLWLYLWIYMYIACMCVWIYVHVHVCTCKRVYIHVHVWYYINIRISLSGVVSLSLKSMLKVTAWRREGGRRAGWKHKICTEGTYIHNIYSIAQPNLQGLVGLLLSSQWLRTWLVCGGDREESEVILCMKRVRGGEQGREEGWE